MIVEAMVRWTEMRIKQTDEGEAQLNRILGGEDQAGFVPEFFHEYAPMTFDMDDVARFNRSHDMQSTTVRFKDGDAYIVNMKYEDFQSFYSQCTKKEIHTVLTSEMKDAADKGSNKSHTPGISEIDGDNFDSI